MVRSALQSMFSSSSSSQSADQGPSSPIVTIFDKRRGQREGDEADKILAFHPAVVDLNLQKGIVGFAEAASVFTGTFSKDQPIKSISTKCQLWVLAEAEPGIFMLVVAQRSGTAGSIREPVLRELLEQAHSAVCLDHGSIQKLLEVDSSGSAARQALARPAAEVGGFLALDKSREVAAALNPLNQLSACPTVRVPRIAFSCMQTLLSSLLTSYGGKAVHGVMVLRSQYLIWSTMGVQDTRALYHFATSTFGGYGQSSRSRSSQKHSMKANHWKPDSWHHIGHGFHALKFPVWRGGVGAPASAQGSRAPPHGLYSARFPSMSLSNGEQQCLAVPYIQNGVLLLLLIDDWVDPSDDMLSGLGALVRTKVNKLSTVLGELLDGFEGGHVPGYRYLYQSKSTNTLQCSPAVKVGTLSRESVKLIHSLRSAVEDRPAAAASLGRGESPGPQEVAPPSSATGRIDKGQWSYAAPQPCREVAVCGSNGCWVVARQSGPRSIVCVMETGQEGLLAASEAANKFVRCNYNGLFDA
mmetsp:Transcript_12340/g.34640  ORF Transcript_12340/g.34640 Transcript_12340/m.34640 type:complete len:526 (+) Transcript_12340:401-1978(+)